MIGHRSTIATIRTIIQACEDLGVDVNNLLTTTGINKKLLNDPDGEITFEKMVMFWKEAYDLSEEPYLAMKAAKIAEIGTYRCLDYISLNSSTLGQAMENFCNYMALVNTWVHWEIIYQEDRVLTRMISLVDSLPPPFVEFVFAVLTKRARYLVNESWAPMAINLPFASTSNPQVYNDYFQSEVHFNTPYAEFIMSKKCWDYELSNADNQLLEILDEHARLLIAERSIPDDFVGKVKKEIIRNLHNCQSLRDTIADFFGMSSRTMQRKLNAYNVNFADLLDEIRFVLAKEKLQDNELSLSEISFLLGFSEQSSFTRAFKRWNSNTPLQYRRSLQ